MIGFRCASIVLLLIFVAGCAKAAPPKPTEHLMLPMPDGVKLATDVYRPEGAGPWPVLMLRSTYGRLVAPFNDLMKRGYAVVVQDIRGMGESEGEKFVFRAEGWQPGLMDGKESVAWVKKQPWCNGKIGTMGGSALGITQMLLAPTTQDLAGQYIEVGPVNFYDGCSYHGGVFQKNMLEGWLTGIKQPHLIAIYKSHPRYDEFWSYYNSVPKMGDITCPAVFGGGWYDIFNQGTIDAFTEREAHGGPGAKGKNYLVMRWSIHGADPKDDAKVDYKLNKNRLDNSHMGKVMDAFLDYNVKGDAHALDGIAKVHYYVMGDDAPGAPGNEWRTAETWPPYPTKATSFFLRDDSTLNSEASGDKAGALDFTFDPKDPFPTHGGQNLMLPSGAFDQRKFSTTRKDLLKLATAVLEKPLEITGRVTVKLFISSDCPDTDFTGKLIDIFPDGREINVLDNIRRVKTREGYDHAAPLLKGQDDVVELDIDLWSAAWVFNKGHKIGLHVSSSNYPHFEVNPNTGEDFPREGGEMRVAHNRVHTGGAHPSALVLPVRQ